MQRKLFRFTGWSLALACLFLLAGSINGDTQFRRAVSLENPALNLPFSDGIVAGNTLYVAGQQGTDAKGNLVEGGVEAQTRMALQNIGTVVKDAGFSMNDVVSVTVYLADIHDFADMNKVYRTILPDPKPARATVQVGGLVNSARVEISAVAVKAP